MTPDRAAITAAGLLASGSADGPDGTSREESHSIRYRAHGHLWALWDGTPAHAPPGRLTHDGAGHVACHLCGHWFTHLGAHLRRHGWTADQYREAVGLPRQQPLCDSSLSRRISARQRERFGRDARFRARLQPGIQLAIVGELARHSARARTQRQEREHEHPAVVSRRRAQLESGRATQALQSRQRIAQVVGAAGVADLHALLRREYAAGASLESLRMLTGLGRERLRAELRAADIPIWPSGHNRPASKRQRAHLVDAQVADALGVADVAEWLREQLGCGATLAALADRTGRSVPWVQSRLQGRTTTAG